LEFLTGISFLISWQVAEKSGAFPKDWGSLFFYWLLIPGFLVIFFTDLEQLIIPDQAVIFLAAVGSLYNFWANQGSLPFFAKNFFLVAFSASLFFLLLYWLTKTKGMGLGDVKLVFALGLIFGFPGTVLAIYSAFLTGALVGVILILTKRSKFGQKIAFGPFLVLGSVLTLFFQKNLEWLIQRIF